MADAIIASRVVEVFLLRLGMFPEPLAVVAGYHHDRVRVLAAGHLVDELLELFVDVRQLRVV